MTNEEIFLEGDYDTLFIKNENFMHLILKRFNVEAFEYEDMIGIGHIAFVKAIKKFDPSIARWTTYYALTLEHEILMAVRHVRVGKRNGFTLSLDDKVNDNQTGHDLCKDDINLEADLIHADEIERLRECILALPERDRVMYQMHLQGKTQTEIAEAIGISQAQVGRVIKKKMQVLKDMLEGRSDKHGEEKRKRQACIQ